ncbi:hybrid sensor histidine kinase/response regulator transcription factor [Chitinophaga terrae (ex Kim and Jung 2007)]|uniref:hybrid sensor histidine kinase/response regulator transcription factor n=1 Tax=Chitinophaga terrae (ex Kim and Jung 2007) TaxID=408074 RepID=UPI00145684DA|nr:response regulator [Chitinophaga terrae (ex Kim and Jung 2007)]
MASIELTANGDVWVMVQGYGLGQRLDYIKKRTDDEIKSIEVPYRNAIFSFDFTALDFSTSNKISYSYYMEGWDKSWNQAGNNSVATYTHLNSGRYIFRVKSTNPEGQWIDNELSLEIIVLPPWYASWWAYLGYMIIVLGIAYIYLVYTKRQRRLKYQVALANMQTEKERELNEKKIAFFTNVSHEFRTPLTLIINPIKVLIARQEFNTNHHPELNIIYRNARRLLRLLDQLLLFRKADITIEDSGCGIPAASAHRIFEKFFRSEGIEHAQKPGFGIGLYLVKQFTELHKGRVTFESREGKGTVFSITLPPGIEQQTEVAESGPAPAITPLLQEMAEDILPETTTGSPAEEALGALISSKPTMLIVDDDPQIRQYISNMFKTGFNIEEAADGKEGLEKTTAIIPNIVISDIRMQSMSGIELCKAIKTNPALNTIPVILLTGTSSEEIKLESAEVGGDHYITKPFEKEFLQAAVQTALQTRSNLRNYFLNEVTLRKNDSKVSGQYKQFVERCIEIVEANLDNDDFNIKILAREIGMSHSSVYKKIRLVSGESLRGFVRFVRLRKAAELMINTSLNVNEIGFQVGINDVKFFRAQFNKVFGMNPSEYIRRYRKVFEDKYSLEKIETRKRRVKQKPV